MDENVFLTTIASEQGKQSKQYTKPINITIKYPTDSVRAFSWEIIRATLFHFHFFFHRICFDFILRCIALRMWTDNRERRKVKKKNLNNHNQTNNNHHLYIHYRMQIHICMLG